MKDPKQISKLISYWLRHAPEEAGLDLDDFGWTDTGRVIDALKKKTIEISADELIEMNKSFDKVRWEFKENRIRATHGHSVPVLIDVSPITPPEFLYHGTAIKNVRRILEEGLKPMSRQFVHLSEDEKMAKQVGARHGKPLLFTVDAEELHKAGVQFFKVNEKVWLTGAIEPAALWAEPWYFGSKEVPLPDLKKELVKEVGPGHLLYRRLETLKLVARRNDRDDVLFEDTASGKYYEVHLTWTGREEVKGFPRTREFSGFDDWLERGWCIDNDNWWCI